MNVLSLFDGMSCGQLALKKLGVEVENYYASEIDKPAIKVTKHNFPDTKHLGDVTHWPLWDTETNLDWSKIDLIIAGSPCQGFSFGGKQLAFNDPRSMLFFEFVKIVEHCKKYNPNVKFFLENVKMKKEHLDVITKFLRVEPVRICSSLMSAQKRVRYYWASWKFSTPKDKGILLKDIVHENLDCDSLGEKISGYLVPFDNSFKVTGDKLRFNKFGYFRKDSQANRVYFSHNKAVCLCGDAGGGAAKMGQYVFGEVLPDKQGLSENAYIRKLTPIECERLQTVPEGYTAEATNNGRYKMLGNGWTVDIIAHIFKSMNCQGGELL